MTLRSKLLGYLKSVRQRRRLLTATSIVSAVAAFKITSSTDEKKDEVVFLSVKENSIPSKAKVEVQPSTLGEMRGPILPNGDINWACSCIERSVIGPCGPEFRAMRQFIHDIDYSKDNLTEEKQKEFDNILEAYFLCTMDNPVYYKSEMLEEERAEYEEMEKMKKQREQTRLENWKRNFRRFGKDRVMFLPVEENNIPSTASIEVTQVEEYRAPLFPNGELNWACTCIERDVVGPCNIEFRKFRQFLHDTKNVKFEEMPPEEQQKQADEMRQIVRSFLACCEEHPVYYSRYLKSDAENDLDENMPDEEKK